jgi:hypothetical protein
MWRKGNYYSPPDSPLQHANNRPTIVEARAVLLRVKKELSLQYESAVRSLEEGFDETLTLKVDY